MGPLNNNRNALHPTICYLPGVDRFLMLTSGNWLKRIGEDSEPCMLMVYEAAKPWGPWKVVKSIYLWVGDDPRNRLYEPSILPKWISPDGQSLWLAYSDCRDSHGLNYKFTIQKMTLILKDPPSAPNR